MRKAANWVVLTRAIRENDPFSNQQVTVNFDHVLRFYRNENPEHTVIVYPREEDDRVVQEKPEQILALLRG